MVNHTLLTNLTYYSPFDPQYVFTAGLIEKTHFSNITVTYREGEVPTPWPWLVANIGTSILLSILGIFSIKSSWGYKVIPREGDKNAITEEELEPHSLFFVIRTNLGGVYVFVRAVVTLILTERVAQTGKGTYGAPSALLVAMCSAQPYIINRALHPLMNALVVIAAFLILGSIAITQFGPHIKDNFYGAYEVWGGICPYYYPYDSCWNNHYSWKQYGCGPYNRAGWQNVTATNFTLPQPDNMDPTPTNAFPVVETICTYAGLIYGVIFLLPSAIYSIGINFSKKKHLAGNPRAIAALAGWSILVSIVVAAVAIPLHVLQQTNPSDITFSDGIGRDSIFNNATNVWSDCFTVHVPKNRLGWWNFWWNSMVKDKATLVGRIIGML